ncbi:hypothetical protein GGR56DRAFT_251998 [Xylariaceae sp. FL0804]|nr:hypothetical protein GGR56DRAFT_251998 [Xylariaceae sp. FL0804]
MPPALAMRDTTDDNWSADDNAPIIIIPACVFLFACPIIVGTRMWSRKRTRAKLGSDDYVILVSLVFAVASEIIMLVGCHYGYGRHAASLTAEQQYEAFKAFYLCQITYKASINLTKASILLLYLRIFTQVRWFRWACRVVLACVAAYCVASVVATVFQCVPVAAAFDKSIPAADKTCLDNPAFWFANAGFSIATDVVILFVPMPLVYALQIPRVQKLALIFVFALGAFVVITSCLRLTTLDLQAVSPDPLYYVSSTMWTLIEMNVAIACACLPQIRPLIVKLFPRLMPTYLHYARGGAGGGHHHHSHHHHIRSGGAKQPAAVSDSSLSSTGRHPQPHPQSGAGGGGGGGGGARGGAGGGAGAAGEGISMTSVRRGRGGGDDDGSSEEYILQDDKAAAAALQIKKTVHVSVEYSDDKLDSIVAGERAVSR